MKQYAVYIRVSTQKQGRSGLGLESQKKICEDFIHSENGNKIAEFMDVESGTHRDRRGLREAITFCQANKCGLVIAKLDRLCRDVEFCFRVVNTGIDIHFCDMPTINTLLLGVFASVAQYERELTSDRTKKALAVKKAQGCRLGRSNPKYIETWNNRTKEEKIMIERKRGEMKRLRFQSSKKTTAFLKILTNVFPDATKNEDPHKWDWKSINTKGDNKDKILNMMKTMRDLDDSGHLFHKFDFDANETTKQQRLGSLLFSMKRTFTY